MPRRTDRIEEKSRKAKLWAVIVGVDRYNDRNIKDLQFCADDALGLAQALQQIATHKLPETEAIFGDVTIKVHSDRLSSRYPLNSTVTSPEKDNILANLDIFSQAQPEDTVLFYFSGHGDYDENTFNTILCISETEKQNLSQTGLLIKTVLTKITASAAKQQLIWLDACHSGSMASQLIEAILQVTKDNPQIYGITACDRDQQSLEIADLGHGLFTYYLIEGLRGGLSNSLIKTDELYHYVFYKTLEYIDRANQLWQLIENRSDLQLKYQSFTPQRLVKGHGEFILGLNSPLAIDNRRRGALVIDGITPSQLTIELSQSLSAKGGFTYQPYRHREESIQESISALLQSSTTTTALLYLKGKFETTDYGVLFIFDDGKEIPRDWLAQQLSDSPIEQQVIILDCSQTANIDRAIETLKQPNKPQCIIAASTDNDWLGKQFLEIIDRNSVDGLTATNLINQFQIAFYSQGILDKQQRDFYLSDKGLIDVILPQTQQSAKVVVDRNYCPYKGLEAFTPQDKDFFFGRDNLTQEIIKQLETTTFLPIVGASGSGKSSLVQAGVIPRLLQEGIFAPEDNLFKPCQVWILRPGEHPIRELAVTLSNDRHSPDYLEGILHLGLESFVTWLRQQPQPMGILVIDQFEELFTLSSNVNCDRFLELIFGAIQYAGDRFKVIITLRNDFMASCLEIPELGEKVKQAPIFVPSYLTESEYRQIITAPATRVGLSVQSELVDVLVEEVLVEKGALPLLEFTLEQLWQNRDRGSLSLKVYREKIGGIKKVLQDRADRVYQELIEPQQECAEWIFTQLVSLGEGQEDTRRRRNLSELVVPKYSQELINSTLDILRESRLIVMSNLDGDLITNRQTESKPKGDGETLQLLELSLNSEVTVEIAHEILIRNWQQLRWWLDENREQIRLRERIEEKAAEWKTNEQKTDYLLRGAALAQAEEFYIKYADELSVKSQEFIAGCIEERDREAKLAKRRRRQVIGSLTGGIVAISMVAGAALWQLQRATINEINALNNSAEALLALNQELDALIVGLKAGKKIKESRFYISRKIEIKTLGILQNIFHQVKEFNRLDNYIDEVNSVAISPNAQLIVSTSGNSSSNSGEIKLWNQEGKLISTLHGHKNYVKKVLFSPDGNLIASADDEIKLWNREGRLLHTLKGHKYIVYQVLFSPNGQLIISSDAGGTVKLWSREGKLLHTLHKSTSYPHQIAISPNGQFIASTLEKTVKLWSREGKLLHTLKGHIDTVNSVAISPNGQFLASASRDGTVKLWSREGKLLHTLKGHTDTVYQVLFSPNGQFLASASSDGTVKLWDREGNLLANLTGNKVGFTEGFKTLAISPNSQLIAVPSEDNTIKLWNQEGKLISTLYGHGGNSYDSTGITNLEFSSNGQFLVSASVDQTVKLWNVQRELLNTLPITLTTEVLFQGAISPDSQLIAYRGENETIKLFTKKGDLISSLQGHTSPLRHVTFSLDGQMIASSDFGGIVKLWNREGKLLRTLIGHTGDVLFVAISPDSQFIASASSDNTIKLWNREGKLLRTLTGHTNGVNRVLFSPDGKFIVSASKDNTVKLWNEYGTLLRTFEGHTDNVRDIAISPNGKRIISASSDNTIKLWNKYGTLLRTFEGHTDGVSRVLFSPDGKFIVSASSDNTVKLWSKDGYLYKTLRNHTNDVYSLDISSDSQIIASGSEDGTVILWSKNGEFLAKMTGHPAGIYQVLFSPDTSFFFSASSNEYNTVKLWSLDLNYVLERGCDWAQDHLANNSNLSKEDKKICK